LKLAYPDAALGARWEALLARAPRLRPWVATLLQQERRRLADARDGEVELTRSLRRHLAEFEALPQFAVSAIATELQEGPAQKSDAHDDGEPDALPANDSPERTAGELDALLGDPAFALAFHCVEVRIAPALPEVARVPRSAWLGLLHASAAQRPALDAATAVGLVLRAQSRDFAALPAAKRSAALRLFCARETGLPPAPQLEKLAAGLPPGWALHAGDLPAFVAGASAARSALGDACRLCARLVAAARTRPGGLSLLEENAGPRAAPEEIAELSRTARQHPDMKGLQRLFVLY
jgi:hypothetical protein